MKKIIALVSLAIGLAVFAYFMLCKPQPVPETSDAVSFERPQPPPRQSADEEFDSTPPTETDFDTSSMDVSFDDAKPAEVKKPETTEQE